MSYHILHINTPNSKLFADKGILFCETEYGELKKISLQDIRAIIVIAYGITFVNHCLSKLLENDVVIMHCNNHFQPAGWSLPLERIVRTKAFNNQIAQNKEFERELWKQILKTKVTNQASLMDLIGNNEHNLYKLINKPLMNEANIAKQYWQHYFAALGRTLKREHANAKTFENGCLNYGYAVIKTLIYRSIIIHGLIAGLGIHHKGKYKSTPLVYDLMEPFRPFVDYYLYLFSNECAEDFKNENFTQWSKYLAHCLKNFRIKINNISYKIIDSIDIYIEKITAAYMEFDNSSLFLPEINQQYLYIDKHRNREYEE